MIFNILAHNRDDHVKNFAFILDPESGRWALSPAYDLTFARGPGGEHSMTVAGEGRHPTRQDVLKLADQADIAWGDAERIIDEVSDAVNAWQSIAQEVGVQKRPSGRSLAP